ncbi:hypothetical protein NQ317_006922 [Molorchus minor]|uniref:Uncharacterized protein n=1 Tax=Molorchus minor TaxID=1323400 RepID=A0ABQ9ISC4_9CUCU|nr:hypothetical protein NQ317_006922 [Molorchus minor]
MQISLKNVTFSEKENVEPVIGSAKRRRGRKKKNEIVEEPQRSTRSRTRAKNLEDPNPEDIRKSKTSAVIIQNITVTTIEISDSDKDAETESEVERNPTESRTTRSKMSKQTKPQIVPKQSSKSDVGKKRARSNSVVDMEKSKSDVSNNSECNNGIQTEYEDAVSTVDTNRENTAAQNVNATYIASDNDKASVESDNEPEKKSPGLKKGNKGTKQIFSPFEKTSLKKKVEAFEKLGVNSSSIPTRVLKSGKKGQRTTGTRDDEDRERPKPATPLNSKFLPKMCSTSIMHYANDVSTSNESIASTKSASALKASQAEFREREKRRQEKERDALKKREALLQAYAEEKRRKREKAQQQRELLEKEKQKQLEVQRVKEEKYKQVMLKGFLMLAQSFWHKEEAEEEAEKKRLLAKKKADMQKEEEIRQVEQKKHAEMKAALKEQKMEKHQQQQQQQHGLPIYFTTEPPLLPTDDCYDSDDPQYEKERQIEPEWSRGEDLLFTLFFLYIITRFIHIFLLNMLATQTPDLQDIFEHVDPGKLKRTSSAVWRKPPRYTLMPNICDQALFSDESD